jgi:putative membrane protein
MTATDLPDINAGLNTLSTVFLVLGYIAIRRGQRQHHKLAMLAALVSSLLFLCSYVLYHYHVGSVPYPHHGWTRPLYFAILIPHIILAALNAPLVVVVVWRAWREDFTRHRRLARWVWPVWLFVSLSGVAVYAMLYRL